MFVEAALIGIGSMAVTAPVHAFILWLRNRKNRNAQMVADKVNDEVDDDSGKILYLKNTELKAPKFITMRTESTQSDDYDDKPITPLSAASTDIFPDGGAFKNLVDRAHYAHRRKRLAKQTLTTTYQRSSKGKVKVQKVDTDQQFVLIENTSSEITENLSRWCLKRSIDDNTTDFIEFHFPDYFELAPNFSVKIYANSKLPETEDDNCINLLASNIENWGIGVTSLTQLYNEQQKLQAGLVQKVSVTKELLPEGSFSFDSPSLPTTPNLLVNTTIFK